MSHTTNISGNDVQVAQGIWTSKTMWVNAITLLIAALTSMVDVDFIQQNPQLLKIGLAVIAMLNIGLRFITNQAIAATNKFVAPSTPVAQVEELKK